MMGKHEEELAQELQRRGMSRRDVLRIGLRLGLGAASMGMLLAACGKAEPAKDAGGDAAAEPTKESIFDIKAGDTGAWPKSAIAEPGDKIEISVGHTWDAVFFERQLQFDKLFMERHPNITVKAENTPWGEYRQKYTAAAAGNAMPDILYTVQGSSTLAGSWTDLAQKAGSGGWTWLGGGTSR
ncbi:MAG: extracellular solute-binding protein, partial [Chloroflexia bacterium]|nr:extracellular solute-binding protein [Chloroflexia bacterium]